MIALETNAARSPDEVFPWDKRDRGLPAWNRDFTLEGAVGASAVWVFQEVAGRVGHSAEAKWVERLSYGNENIGEEIDLRHFWLAGPLKISAEEQIDFLVRFNTGQLPISDGTSAATKEAMLLGRTPEGHGIYGKTGAMLPIDDTGFLRMDSKELLPLDEERTGWFVGWIDRSSEMGGPVYFALNLDLAAPEAMQARTAATYALLAANGYPRPLE